MRLTMQPKVRITDMQNRAMALVCRVGVAVIAVALSAITANAQTLLNGGFESGSPPTPSDWTVFNFAYMTGTNCPPDGNNTCTNLTVHSGEFSLKTYGPFGVDFDASGAYQDLTGASVGQTWKLSGYVLNYSAEALSGSNGWGVAQIQFLDSTNGLIQVSESGHFGTDTPLPVDQWTPFQAVGTVPAGTVTMRIQVLHVGMAGTGGSVWWDDVTLSQRTGTTNVVGAASQYGVQVAWPTKLAVSYQPQTNTNLLVTSAWTNFGGAIIGSSNSNQVFDTLGSNQQKYYRVRQQQ
jgi:hypothetical protein